MPSVGVNSLLMAKGSTFTVPVSRSEGLTQSWRSSYSGVAAVSPDGEITAAREGTATVYCDFSDTKDLKYLKVEALSSSRNSYCLAVY